MSYRQWGRKESDTTERLDFRFQLRNSHSLRNMCFKSPLEIYLFLSTPLNKIYLSLSSFPLYENVSELTFLHHFPGPLGKTFADKNIHSFIIRIPSLLAVLSRVWLLETPWTITGQVSLSMELSSQEYRSGWPFPPPGDLPNTAIEPSSLVSPALAGKCFTTVPPGPYL